MSLQYAHIFQGDYNMTPDRHLGAAWIDKCRPDVLITESTYATTIRDSKRCRERDFLKKVHDCVDKGGKVSMIIIPCPSLKAHCALREKGCEATCFKYVQLCLPQMLSFTRFFLSLGFNSSICTRAGPGIVYLVRNILG